MTNLYRKLNLKYTKSLIIIDQKCPILNFSSFYSGIFIHLIIEKSSHVLNNCISSCPIFLHTTKHLLIVNGHELMQLSNLHISSSSTDIHHLMLDKSLYNTLPLVSVLLNVYTSSFVFLHSIGYQSSTSVHLSTILLTTCLFLYYIHYPSHTS